MITADIATDAQAWDVLADIMASTADDPVGFHDLILERPPLWERQEEILESIIRYKVTVVYAGNMVGKDYAIAGTAVPWWLLTRPQSLAIITGPSQTNLGSIVFKELRKALDSAILPFGGRISAGIKASPAVAEVRPGWMAMGLSTDAIERLSGQHAAHLLAVVGEASGVGDETWEGVDSLGYERMIAYGNPIRAEGRFVDLIRQADRDKRDGIPDHEAVNAIRIPSTDSPHATWDSSPIGLASRPWIEGMTRKYGANSLWVKSHIRAEIPEASAEILIPQEMFDYLLAQPAPIRPPGHPIAATRRIAVDLSEGVGRDSCCVMVVDDWGVLDCTLSSGIGLPEAASVVAQKASQWNVPHNRISYDKLGVGKDFPVHLARYDIRTAQPYAGSGTPRDRAAFVNLRSEGGWTLRQRMDMTFTPWTPKGWRVQVPFNFAPGKYIERLREDIRPLTYSLVGKAVKLLDKDLHSAALGRSPDVYDTLAQAHTFFYEVKAW